MSAGAHRQNTVDHIVKVTVWYGQADKIQLIGYYECWCVSGVEVYAKSTYVQRFRSNGEQIISHDGYYYNSHTLRTVSRLW